MSFVPHRHLVQYYETDQMGIIHHSNYIRWFEEARIDFMNQIGLTYKTMEEKGIISKLQGTKPRKVLISKEYWDMIKDNNVWKVQYVPTQ